MTKSMRRIIPVLAAEPLYRGRNCSGCDPRQPPISFRPSRLNPAVAGPSPATPGPAATAADAYRKDVDATIAASCAMPTGAARC